MREDFLFHIWKFRKFRSEEIRTTENDLLTILHPGSQNEYSGPDFFNSRIIIGDQLWAGNVEVHIKSSHWYAHKHETDSNYDNVILHVVWEDDADIYRKDGSKIPTLVMKGLVEKDILNSYNELLEKTHSKLNCEKNFASFSDFQITHWLERLYFERLEEKSNTILRILEQTGGNWEATLFIMLAKGFGLNVNGENFKEIASSFDFRVLQKLAGHPFRVEALLLGQAKLIEGEEHYSNLLRREFEFLKRKYSLSNEHLSKPEFFRLRPDNFPTIRLAQLAGLYSMNANLFAKLVAASKKEEIYSLFSRVELPEFWKTHYNFGRSHSKRKKKLSKAFMNLQIINCILPLKYTFSRNGCREETASFSDLISSIEKENNKIVRLFNSLRPGTANNAMESQALLTLKKQYCDKNKCLNCELGISLLRKSGKTLKFAP